VDLVARSGELEGPLRIAGTAGVWDGSSVVRCNSWSLLRKVLSLSLSPEDAAGVASVWSHAHLMNAMDSRICTRLYIWKVQIRSFTDRSTMHEFWTKKGCLHFNTCIPA
jgi:hypothetical protein